MPPFCHGKHSRLSRGERFIFRHGFRLTWSISTQQKFKWSALHPFTPGSCSCGHIHPLWQQQALFEHMWFWWRGKSLSRGNLNVIYWGSSSPLYYSTFWSLKLLSSDKHSCSGGLDVSWFVKLTQIMSNIDLSLLFPASTFPERDVLLLFPVSLGLTAASSL